MGLIRDWIKEMGDMWRRAEQGDASAFIGLPRPAGKTGTGSGATPDGSVLTEAQHRMLTRVFHESYGRYPLSEYEFQQWLRDNW